MIFLLFLLDSFLSIFCCSVIRITGAVSGIPTYETRNATKNKHVAKSGGKRGIFELKIPPTMGPMMNPNPAGTPTFVARARALEDAVEQSLTIDLAIVIVCMNIPTGIRLIKSKLKDSIVMATYIMKYPSAPPKNESCKIIFLPLESLAGPKKFDPTSCDIPYNVPTNPICRAPPVYYERINEETKRYSR